MALFVSLHLRRSCLLLSLLQLLPEKICTSFRAMRDPPGIACRKKVRNQCCDFENFDYLC